MRPADSLKPVKMGFLVYERWASFAVGPPRRPPELAEGHEREGGREGGRFREGGREGGRLRKGGREGGREGGRLGRREEGRESESAGGRPCRAAAP